MTKDNLRVDYKALDKVIHTPNKYKKTKVYTPEVKERIDYLSDELDDLRLEHRRLTFRCSKSDWQDFESMGKRTIIKREIESITETLRKLRKTKSKTIWSEE